MTARSYGGPEVLAVETMPVPTPGADEVLVEVRASSLNALDWHFLTGTPYLMRLLFGLRRPKRERIVRGADVAGVVVAVGDAVTRFEVGDGVFGGCDAGGCGEYLTVKESSVVAIPDSVSFEAGGVGTMAVQIAKALGGHVTAVCSTRNVDMVRHLGADVVLDYTVDDFVVDGARFDVMLDNVGNRHPRECRSVLREGGRYVVVSGPKANRWVDPLPYLARARLAFVRADASFHQFTAAVDVDDLTVLGEYLSSGQLVPHIDRIIGFDRVAGALAEIGTGHARAKIVVRGAGADAV